MVKLIYKKLHIKRVRKEFITHKSKNINKHRYYGIAHRSILIFETSNTTYTKNKEQNTKKYNPKLKNMAVRT